MVKENKIKTNTIIEKLQERFGAEQVELIPIVDDEIQLALIHINAANLRVITTIGLSDYCMPVPEKMEGREWNEIFFCLPSYWDLTDRANPSMNWVFDWIQRLAKYVVEKNTWFGPGHTIPCGNPFVSLSSTMRQNHFILVDPILLQSEFQPIQLADKTIHFLGILPIFEEEMDYKQGRGTYKLLKKFNSANITEKLDDFRGSALKSKWRFWK